MFKQIAVGTAALALPLALVAAPAQAGERGKGADDPSVEIKKVQAAKKGFNVKVKYECDTEQDKHHKKGKEDKWGKLEVSLTQKHVKYDGEKWVKCDGEAEKVWVYLDHDYGHLYTGKAEVKAKLTDPQHEKAYDSEYVKIKVRSKH